MKWLTRELVPTFWGVRRRPGSWLKKMSTLPKSGVSPRARWSLVIILCGFLLYFIAYVVFRHAAFDTAGYDLGNVSQSIWNTLRGKPLAMTTMPQITSRWALHFEPILLLLVPLYAVFPSPVMLTGLQVLVVAVGALPIFWLAGDLFGTDWAGVLYAGVYLMYPALQAAVVFDFHGVTLAATFLAFALWALLRGRYVVFGVASLMAMSCKEDVPLLVLMMGLYVLLIQRQWRVALASILVAVTWFVIANFVIIPAHSPIGDNIHIARYGELGSSMDKVIVSVLIRPLHVLAVAFETTRLPYWVLLTMPVAFTSFLDPALFLMALPSLAINTLSSNSATYTPDRFHYTAPVVPFIVVASISGVARLSRQLGRGDEKLRSVWRNRMLIVVLAASLAYHLMAGYTPLRLGFRWPTPDAHDLVARRMLEKIPPQASVSAANSLVPRLANRSHIYIFPKNEGAEYVAIDTQSSYFPFGDRDELCGEARQLLTGSDYGVIFFSDGLLLLQRDVPHQVEVSPDVICSQEGR
jgi:uncharacterized membrane protein